MEGKNQHLAIRGCISQWILICLILPLSDAVCNAPNCNPSQCNGIYCYSCNDGYYLQSGSCVQCPDRCYTCTSSIQCTTYCHCMNEELYGDLNRCHQQMKAYKEREDQYQLSFGHGLATGIGIAIVLFGLGHGIALFIKRRTKLNQQENKASDETNVYVNTNMSNTLSVIASENNEVTNDIPAVSSDSTNTRVTDIDSSRDYVSLGDRQNHESNYSELITQEI